MSEHHNAGRAWGKAVTNREKTVCKRNHLLAETATVFIDIKGRPHRRCRECRARREQPRGTEE